MTGKKISIFRRIMPQLALGLLLPFVGIFYVRGAEACTPPPYLHFPIDTAAGVEQYPEAAPDVEVVQIRRGQKPRKINFGTTVVSNSCDDIGRIDLRIRNASEDFGYIIKYLRGELPDGLNMPMVAAPLRTDEDGALYLSWVDGATSDQEDFDFFISITPIARDGAIGPTSEPIRIKSTPDSAACSTSGPDSVPVTGLLIGGVLILVSVRRHRCS